MRRILSVSVLCWSLIVSANTQPSYSQIYVYPSEYVNNSDSSEMLSLPGLDAGLSAAETHHKSQLFLVPETSEFTIQEHGCVKSDVKIEGNGGRVEIGAEIVVELNGILDVWNVTFAQQNCTSLRIFAIFGSATFTQCVFASFSTQLFTIFGLFAAAQMQFVQNSAAILAISSPNSTVSLANSDVFEHIGTFLISMQGWTSVVVSNCTFHSGIQRKSEPIFNFILKSNQNPHRNLTFSDCVFRSNVPSLFYFDVWKSNIAVRNCIFEDNKKTVFFVLIAQSSLLVDNCKWMRNAWTIFEVRLLEGLIAVKNGDVSNQISAAIVTIFNSGDYHSCFFIISNSQIHDIAVYSDYHFSAAISAYHCHLTLQNTAVENSTMSGPNFNTINGFVQVEFGLLSLENTYFEDSGSSGTFLLTLYSHLRIINSTLNNPISGQNFVITNGLGSVSISNLTIIDGSRTAVSNELKGWKNFIYTAFYFSDVNIDRLAIFHKRELNMSLACMSAFSRFNVTGMKLMGLSLDIGFAAMESAGCVDTLFVQNSIFRHFVIEVFSNTSIIVSNVFLTNVTIQTAIGGVIYMGMHSSFVSNTMIIDQFQGKALAQGRNSTLQMINLSIDDCKFRYFLDNILNCNVNVRNLTIFRSKSGIISGMQSKIAIENAKITKVMADDYFFTGFSVILLLTNVSFSDGFANLSLGKLIESSQFSLNFCQFANIGSLWGEGIRVNNGFLSVSNSDFHHFNVSLFHCESSEISIKSSIFANGRNPTIYEKSTLAYGGVLGCVDCSNIDIDGLQCSNISAKIAGAIAVRSVRFDSIFRVRNSVFLSGKATIAGAIFIENVNFTIESSIFQSNSAEKSGGAIDVSVQNSQQAIIENCTFVNNSAYEGGGIYRRSAEIHLKSTFFDGNSAFYGPNIASFGVKIVSTPVQSVVPGSPISLQFSLLDHYNSIVTTASNLELSLLSSETVTYRGNSATVSNRGVFLFAEITIYAPPGTTQIILGNVMQKRNLAMDKLIANVEIPFRNCSSGEIFRYNMCEMCHFGNVSLSTDDRNCRFCPANAICPGGNRLISNPNHWRNSLNSTNVIQCPLREKCLGGENSTCAEGFTGKVCNECQKGYFRIKFTECVECLSTAGLSSQIFAIVLAAILYFFLLIRVSERPSSLARLFAVKTAMQHLQLLSFTIAPLKVTFPREISFFLHAITYLGSFGISDFPFACFGVSSPEVLRSLCGALLLPFVSLLLLPLLYLLPSPLSHHRIMLILTSLTLHSPAISISTTVPLLACQQIDSEQKYQFTDMSTQCWTDAHKRLIFGLVIPGVILNGFGPACVGFWWICRGKREFGGRFVLWTAGYRWEFWDLVMYFPRLALIWIATNTITYEKLAQITSAFCVLILIAILNVFFEKSVFSTTKGFILSQFSVVSVAFSLAIGAYYVYNEAQTRAIDYCFTAFFYLTNLSFLLISLYFSLVGLGKPETDRCCSSEEMLSGPPPPLNSIISETYIRP